MKVKAYAKINWSLDITGVREDGYHLMDMLMQPISLADELEIEPAEELRLRVTGFPRVGADENNLVIRAARELQARTGCRRGAAMVLRKRIPVQAGLGGGSSDAAAALRGLDRLWETHVPEEELERIALGLGADVPFFLRGGLVRTQGIGEELTPLPWRKRWPLVIVQPAAGLSTGKVFSAFDAEENVRHPDTELAMRGLAEGRLDWVRKGIGNVLQPVSEQLCPEIRLALQELVAFGAKTACMTGSGSAVFGVFASRADAERAWRHVRKRWRSAFVCVPQENALSSENREDP